MPLVQSLAQQVPNKQLLVVIIISKMTVTMMMVMMINLSFKLYFRLFPLLETPPY